MIRLNTLGRLLHIRRVLLRNGLDEILEVAPLPLGFRGLIKLSIAKKKFSAEAPRGLRIRLALEELGPIFVKFGQTLSTRRDLLPDDIAEELVKLQDRVPPFPGKDARTIIEEALEAPVSLLFSEFDETPLASASVAQVHPARLHSGEEVVVKVLRPGIEANIRTDLALLFELARLANKYWKSARWLRPIEVVAEFEKTILDELDLIREAANAAEIRRRFEGSEMLYIPKVYFEYTRRNVLVMERISGIPIGNLTELRKQGVDLKLLAERGVEIFFTQVLRDSLFHADMHPGNIFATLEAQYIAIDFGIVGSISYEDKRYIAENFRAFFNRDYRRVAEMHIESGWIPKETRVTDFEGAIRAVCEPIFEKPLKDISYGHLLLRLFQVARRYDMEVQPQLVLLQKTLLNIEGLGRELYPELDLWKTAKPFIENWFKSEIGLSASLDQIKTQLPDWAQHWPEMPMLVHRTLTDFASGNTKIQFQSKELESLRNELRYNQRRNSSLFAGSALLVCTSIVATSSPSIYQLWTSVILGTLATLLLARAML